MKFLFQIGSIKSRKQKIVIETLMLFLFQIGSIKSWLAGMKQESVNWVSIPNWFD